MAGASNAARTAAALVRRGERAEKVSQLGWSLAIEKDTDVLIAQLGLGFPLHGQRVFFFHEQNGGV